MTIIYTIKADCDPPPNDDFMQLHGEELDEALEDAVADFLMRAGAGFSIDVSARLA